jgi:hypothetical protein
MDGNIRGKSASGSVEEPVPIRAGRMILRLLKTFLRGLLKTFVVLLWIGTVWIVLEHYLSRESCVVLPNGYMIGYPNIFGPEDEGLVDMILRDPSGKIVIRTNADVPLERVPGRPNRVKMIYPGGAMEMDGTKMMPLIWEGHPITGPKHKWNEPKPGYPDSVSILYTDFWGIYLWLRRSNKFETVSCGTPLFDFGDATRRYCPPESCE